MKANGGQAADHAPGEPGGADRDRSV